MTHFAPPPLPDPETEYDIIPHREVVASRKRLRDLENMLAQVTDILELFAPNNPWVKMAKELLKNAPEG